ncbi:UbiA family prenyltransferase [Streptomyces sp. KM273126]|uniref:SCO3242 family prenyltransferase n=1 Tax=Streptomyces sp. KM273126 TaxID=2545247 RepID=UPI0015EBBF79|nr:UbiA family prenyltransferase [Streptomyces sp. KM273126]MBA2810165.1 UbiA family prenyltransferase [Streptomyces sp. KM273126]
MRTGPTTEAKTKPKLNTKVKPKLNTKVNTKVKVKARAWAELLRLPALFTVPGDALAGAAAAGAALPNARTLLAIGSSLCLYEAGMALNDWADHAEDAVERPHRPLPSGRVRPASALAAAGALTAAGLALAARAGRPALTVAVPLAATVWSYDLTLKRTPAGPLAMGAARTLDVLLGAAATTGTTRAALPSALALGAHTFAVTTVSRHETQGGSALAPLAGLATTGILAWRLTRGHTTGRRTAGPSPSAEASVPGPGLKPGRTADAAGSARLNLTNLPVPTNLPGSATLPSPTAALHTALTITYAATTARPLFHATLNPSPPLTQRAVGSGIRALIPLQAALTARAGASGVALLTAALAPAARSFARKVSVT